MNPKVTVLMPVYNAAKYLREAIESVLAQSYRDFEFLIVNDGSKDGSADIIRSFSDSRIHFVDNAANAGVIQRLNEGLEVAHGEIIARIDADDVWTDRQKLAKQVAYLEANPRVGLVGILGVGIDPAGKQLFQLDYPLDDAKLRKDALVRNNFINCSVAFRKSLAKQVGGYDRAEKHAEDYGLWLRIGTISEIANLPDRMVAYRITPEGDSLSNNERSIRNSIALAKKHRKNYPSYFRALLKWNTKLALLRVIGLNAFSTLKKALRG